MDVRVRLVVQTTTRSVMNIRQANGLGRVHVANAAVQGDVLRQAHNDEDWVTTTKEANCTGCARAGAPVQERATGAAR